MLIIKTINDTNATSHDKSPNITITNQAVDGSDLNIPILSSLVPLSHPFAINRKRNPANNDINAIFKLMSILFRSLSWGCIFNF